MTYEYICTNCKHEWEEQQGIKEDPVKKCPECGEDCAQRQISLSAFVLKGDHWYRTGY